MANLDTVLLNFKKLKEKNIFNFAAGQTPLYS
jgi:hypothetical protein